MASSEKLVRIYTDGGCDPNPGTGGWGAVLICDDTEKELSGGACDTTNNRMEMTAAIEALRALKRRSRVVVYTDSQYLKNGVTDWMPKWKKNGWRRGKKAVKNLDLWQHLDSLLTAHDIEWQWLRGHTGDYYNERCDALATEAIKEQKKQ